MAFWFIFFSTLRPHCSQTQGSYTSGCAQDLSSSPPQKPRNDRTGVPWKLWLKEHELGAGLWRKNTNWSGAVAKEHELGAELGEDFLGLRFSVPVAYTLGRLYTQGVWESPRNHGAYSSLPSLLLGGCSPARWKGGRGKIPSPYCEGHLLSEQDHPSAMFVPSVVLLNVVSTRTHPWRALDQTPKSGVA